MNLCDLTVIRPLLARHGFHFSKSMGQNFLIESWVPRDIAAASGADKQSGVLEIGPGIGPLTRELSALAGQVVSVELDRSLLPVLAETLADCPNTQIVNADILKVNLPALVAEKFGGLSPMVCANLPYNITTPVLTALIDSRCFPAITVLIQREVALRICARPGTADYGAFSVYMQYYTQPQLLFDVPPDCFLPAPKVTSSVLRCTLRQTPPVEADQALFFRTVRSAFALRRKTLVNSLQSGFGGQLSKQQLTEAVTACGLPEAIRGERLGLEDFAALSRELGRRLD